MTEEKRAYAPGEKPCTPRGSAAGETWHYRDENGEKLEPVAYIYTRTNGKWGGEAGNLIFLEETRELVEEKVESELLAQGYAIIPAVVLIEAAPEDRIRIESSYNPYFPTADVCISAPNVEIGVSVPEMDPDSDGEGFVLTKPGSVMLVGGDIKFCEYAGNQPTICHLIDHASGDTFTIPPHISDQEVMALVQARRQYVRDNLRQNTPPVPDAAPDNDEWVN